MWLAVLCSPGLWTKPVSSFPLDDALSGQEARVRYRLRVSLVDQLQDGRNWLPEVAPYMNEMGT